MIVSVVTTISWTIFTTAEAKSFIKPIALADLACDMLGHRVRTIFECEMILNVNLRRHVRGSL